IGGSRGSECGKYFSGTRSPQPVPELEAERFGFGRTAADHRTRNARSIGRTDVSANAHCLRADFCIRRKRNVAGTGQCPGNRPLGAYTQRSRGVVERREQREKVAALGAAFDPERALPCRRKTFVGAEVRGDALLEAEALQA